MDASYAGRRQAMAVIAVEPVPTGAVVWWLSGAIAMVLAVVGYRTITAARR